MHTDSLHATQWRCSTNTKEHLENMRGDDDRWVSCRGLHYPEGFSKVHVWHRSQIVFRLYKTQTAALNKEHQPVRLSRRRVRGWGLPQVESQWGGHTAEGGAGVTLCNVTPRSPPNPSPIITRAGPSLTVLLTRRCVFEDKDIHVKFLPRSLHWLRRRRRWPAGGARGPASDRGEGQPQQVVSVWVTGLTSSHQIWCST